jgi:regulator of replication initiation timing
MNEQEQTAEQEKLEYEAFVMSDGRIAIAHAKGIRLLTMQSFADELNEITRNLNRVLRQRDEARDDIRKLVAEREKEQNEARSEVERLRRSFSEYDNRIQQELGKELGYPWYKDSQEHFPGATEASGVCVGDHVGETLAAEAAEKIRDLRAEVEKLKEQLYAEIKKNTITIPIRPEPSRLEIAAMLLSGAMADPSVEGSCINHTWFLRQADALIAAAKEEPSK